MNFTTEMVAKNMSLTKFEQHTSNDNHCSLEAKTYTVLAEYRHISEKKDLL